LDNAYQTKIFLTPISKEWKEINAKLCIEGVAYIDFLENGGKLEENSDFQQTVRSITEAQIALKENLKLRATELMKRGKLVGVLGGEHSTPLGLIEAIDARGEAFGILQIDAHADLRDAYEGFDQSHASIMFNCLKNCSNLTKLVQVGIRDIAQSEVDIIENSKGRVQTYFDWNLKEGQFNGETWSSQVDRIIADLPSNVYISFDIDGLSPELCPNTGTPVAGGFKLEEINSENFEKKALEVFQFQRKTNPIYAAYCQSIQNNEVDQLEDIPFLPISFFKTHQVICLLDSDLNYFESSGTSGQVNAKHYYRDLSLYHQSIELSFRHFFGNKKYTIVGLLPHYLERQHSSLVAMVRHWMQMNEQEEYFFLHDFKKLADCLDENSNQEILLIGISFALLDFVEYINQNLKLNIFCFKYDNFNSLAIKNLEVLLF
jgi:hypothetical protein